MSVTHLVSAITLSIRHICSIFHPNSDEMSFLVSFRQLPPKLLMDFHPDFKSFDLTTGLHFVLMFLLEALQNLLLGHFRLLFSIFLIFN